MHNDAHMAKGYRGRFEALRTTKHHRHPCGSLWIVGKPAWFHGPVELGATAPDMGVCQGPHLASSEMASNPTKLI